MQRLVLEATSPTTRSLPRESTDTPAPTAWSYPAYMGKISTDRSWAAPALSNAILLTPSGKGTRAGGAYRVHVLRGPTNGQTNGIWWGK